MAGTVQTNPPILSPVAHSTVSRQKDRDLRQRIATINRLTAEVGNEVCKLAFPCETLALQKERAKVVNPPLFGSSENVSFSTFQVNLSRIGDTLEGSLGKGANIHSDMSDEPCGLSLLICLSNVASTVSSGEFFM